MFEYLIFIFIGVILFTLADVTRKKGFDKLSISRHIDKNKVNINEECTITTIIENKKNFPISYLNLRQAIPGNIVLANTSGEMDNYKFKIGKNQRIKRSVKARAGKRGVYLFGNIDASIGDMFGFALTSKVYNSFNEIVVYPRVLPVNKFKVKNIGNLGDRVIMRWIAEDNLYIKGIRDYTANDRMKDIDWKAASRSGRLVVKEYDNSSNMKIAVILNVQCGEPYWKNINADLIEKSIELSVSIVKSATRMGIDAGFYTNAMLVGAYSENFKGINPALNSFGLILETCARISYDVRINFKEYLQKNINNFYRDTVYVLITNFLDDEIKNKISAIEKAGINFKIIDMSQDEEIYYDK